MEEDLQEVEATFEAQTTSFALMERVVWEYQRRMQQSLREIGLGLREHQALSGIRRAGHLRQARLADRCFVSRQRMHRVVRVLERNGLVKTWSDPERRDVRVILTDEGKRVLSEADAAVARLHSGILRRFGVQHQAALTTLLRQVEVALRLWATSPDLFDD